MPWPVGLVLYWEVSLREVSLYSTLTCLYMYSHNYLTAEISDELIDSLVSCQNFTDIKQYRDYKLIRQSIRKFGLHQFSEYFMFSSQAQTACSIQLFSHYNGHIL